MFEILSGKDQIRFIRDVMKSLKYKDLAIGMVLREISLAKNNLITIAEFRDLYAGDKTMLKVADVFELYDRRKASKMLMDFDDLLGRCLSVVESQTIRSGRNTGRFSGICLSTNFRTPIPFKWKSSRYLLPSDNGNDSSFWICGDDAQSIYGFTGASVGNILNFKSMFPESEQIILESQLSARPRRFFVPVRTSSVTTKSRFKRRLKQEILMGMMSLSLNHHPRKQRP